MKILVVHLNPCKHLLKETRKALIVHHRVVVNFSMYLQIQKTCHQLLNRRQLFSCHQMFLLKVRSKIWSQILILLHPSIQLILQHQISPVISRQQRNEVRSFPVGKKGLHLQFQMSSHLFFWKKQVFFKIT